MTNNQFERKYWPKYESVIRAIARKLAQKNDALMEDLVQEGAIALLDLQPRKAKKNEDAYIRQAVKFRMIDYMRRERPAKFDSLNAHMERGGQVVRDEDTGEIRLLTFREHDRRPHLLEEDSRASQMLEEDYGSSPIDRMKD